MKKIFIILVLHCLSISLSAQFVDNFSDATLGMHWQGDTDLFTINSGELQLNDLDAGSSNNAYLYTLAPTSLAETTQWSFSIRCEFSPSSGNFTTIYLATEQAVTDGGSFNGYFLKVGGISGSNDALELYRQDGNNSTLLISGTVGAVGADPVTVGVFISRTPTGIWTLEADYTGGENYDAQGTATDNTYANTLYFGLNCHYTSTRNTAFFYDNIFIDPIVEDNDGPIAQNIEVLTSTSIVVYFNEPLDAATALNTTNYTLNNGIGNPQTASFQNGNPANVVLSFSQNLVNLTDYILALSGIEDLSNNNSGSQTLDFNFLLAETPLEGDLLITEILADPTPPLGLPNAEYIELYNTSNKVLQLGGLGFSTGSSPKEIDNFTLLPQAYVILCDIDDKPSFQAFGDVATVSSFPALTNGGDDLSLLTPQGAILVEVNYDINWFQNNERAAGGYSLELIDLNLANNCPGNWRGSESNLGGTPGQANSIDGIDLSPPNITTAFANSPTEIVIHFDNVLGDNSDFASFFSINPDINIGDAMLDVDKKGVILFLEQPLSEGIVYEITASVGIEDCLGNTTTSASSVFTGLAVRPAKGDLILNEILFNPYTGGVDFIEFYNPSDKILNIQGIRLRNEFISSGTISTVIEADYVLLPDSYVALTPNVAVLSSQYQIANPATLLENRLPSLGDKEGNILVLGAILSILDSLHYNENWHNQLLSDRNGVSLERLRADNPTQDKGNWHSAASTAGHATPGAVNSQDRKDIAIPTDDFFNLPEKTFSPDQDGFQDVLELQYNTEKAGYVGQFYIFDAQGRLILEHPQLELLAGKGSFLWDGNNNDGEKARIGIYVILAEIFTPEGDKMTEKHSFVLAGKLE